MEPSRDDAAPYALDPFGPSANPAAYVPNEASERARQAMHAALDVSRSTVVVGPPGHGKTLLLHLVGARQGERSRVAYLPFASLGVEEFFAMALEALGRPPRGESAREAFGALVAELGPRGGVTLLIDDAHSMHEDTARALGEIHRVAHGDLRLVLAALEGDAALGVIAALGRNVDVVNLYASLSEAEARRYIEVRLAYAGARPELARLFDDAQVSELHRTSDGVPRQLNQAAQEVVRHSAAEPLPKLRDAGFQPPVEDEAGEGGLSLSSLAERVLGGENVYTRLPEPAVLPEKQASSPRAVDPEPDTRAREEPRVPDTRSRQEPRAAAAEPREAEPVAKGPLPAPPSLDASVDEASILEPDPAPVQALPAAEELRARPVAKAPPRLSRESAPAEGSYRLARASARPGNAAGSDFSAPPVVQRDPTPAPGFETETRSLLWSRQTAVSIARWMAFGAGVGLAVMWWAGQGADLAPTPPRGLTTANEVMERVQREPSRPTPSRREEAGPSTPAASAEPGVTTPTERDPFEHSSRPLEPASPPPPVETGSGPLPQGTVPVSINATPWATIEVDGRPLGETPLARIPLAPGPHLFRATLPDGSVREQTVEIGPDRRAVSFR